MLLVCLECSGNLRAACSRTRRCRDGSKRRCQGDVTVIQRPPKRQVISVMLNDDRDRHRGQRSKRLKGTSAVLHSYCQGSKLRPVDPAGYQAAVARSKCWSVSVDRPAEQVRRGDGFGLVGGRPVRLFRRRQATS